MKPMQAKVAGIPSKIVGFHLDGSLDWVADLECGHQQHVRHNPPCTTRHWVTTSQGRLEHIGRELLCSLCIQIMDGHSRMVKKTVVPATCLWRIDTVGVKGSDPRSAQQPRTQTPDDLIGSSRFSRGCPDTAAIGSLWKITQPPVLRKNFV
jgi:Protein of unknown function (DUF3565)